MQVITQAIDSGDGVCIGRGCPSTTKGTMNYSSSNHSDLNDKELSLSDLASVNGGIAPIVLPVVFYLLYKGAKKVLDELDTVDQNLDTSDSEGSNKLSYIDGIKDEKDPFNGAFTGKK